MHEQSQPPSWIGGQYNIPSEYFADFSKFFEWFHKQLTHKLSQITKEYYYTINNQKEVAYFDHAENLQDALDKSAILVAVDKSSIPL